MAGQLALLLSGASALRGSEDGLLVACWLTIALGHMQFSLAAVMAWLASLSMLLKSRSSFVPSSHSCSLINLPSS